MGVVGEKPKERDVPWVDGEPLIPTDMLGMPGYVGPGAEELQRKMEEADKRIFFGPVDREIRHPGKPKG